MLGTHIIDRGKCGGCRFSWNGAHCSLPLKFKCGNREDTQEHRGTRWEEWFRHQLLPELRKEAEMSEEKSTVGRSCASCPEMGNPDSYISHLQAALRWHDEHVPRPTNPRNTCVVLKGENKPDEVLFIHDEGGEVTHYLPEDAGTCRMKLMENMHTSAYQDMYECDRCGEQVLRETYMGKSEPPKFCPECGRRNEVSE